MTTLRQINKNLRRLHAGRDTRRRRLRALYWEGQRNRVLNKQQLLFPEVQS
jgi:hypothetical protein